MIKLWLHSVTLYFLKCFIPSACYRLCNTTLLSLLRQIDSPVFYLHRKNTKSRTSVFLYVSCKSLNDVFSKRSHF